MPLSSYADQMLPAVEQEMKTVIDLVLLPAMPLENSTDTNQRWEFLHHMLSYHMGWTIDKPEVSGKRVRPLLLMLVSAAAGGRWQTAVPAAAAVELLHNFSLIHDDVEDDSPLRRGRPTLWKNWGVPQAINTGDVLFTLSHLALLRLQPALAAEHVLQAAQIFHHTCLALTQGQYLDMLYENSRSLPVEDYWPMISGKTASLVAACTRLGALIGQADETRQQAYHDFGLYLGLAFQIQDDMLGIWGSAETTGKSAASDLISGKKSLPVLFGLAQEGAFSDRWLAGPIKEGEVEEVADLLKTSGAYEYAGQKAQELTEAALQALEAGQPEPEAGAALAELATQLLSRQV